MTRQESVRAPLRDSERLLLQQRALQQELGQVRAAITSSAKVRLAGVLEGHCRPQMHLQMNNASSFFYFVVLRVFVSEGIS